MTNQTMYSLEYGPNRDLAEQGVYNTQVPRLPGTSPGIMPPNNVTAQPSSPAYLAPPITTGGTLPPNAMPMVNTGGGLRPNSLPIVRTGGPGQVFPSNGNTGIVPPTIPGIPPGTPPSLDINSQTGVPNAPNASSVADLISQMWQQMGGGTYTPGQRQDVSSLANQIMNGIVGDNSPYIQLARQQALAQANSRGALNSSIGAGAGQAAAINAAMPMFQQAYGLAGQREQNDFNAGQNDLDRAMQRLGQGTQLYGQAQQQQYQSGQNALDRLMQKYNTDTSLYNDQQARNLQKYGIDTNLLNSREDRNFQTSQNALDRTLKEKLQSDATFQQDWLNNQTFTRQFNAALSMIPINSADQLTQMLAQYGAQNPEVFTPEVMSGMVNFLTKNMAAIIDQYFKVGK